MSYEVRMLFDEDNELMEPTDGQTVHELWTSFNYDDISVYMNEDLYKWAFRFTTTFDRNYSAVYVRLGYVYPNLYTKLLDIEANEVTTRVHLYTIRIGNWDNPAGSNKPLRRMNSCKPTSI